MISVIDGNAVSVIPQDYGIGQGRAGIEVVFARHILIMKHIVSHFDIFYHFE